MKKSVKKRQTGILVITLAVLALFAVLFTRGLELKKKRDQLTEELNEKNNKYEIALEHKEDLKYMKEYMSTLEYIKDVAREKLGLVDKDDVIFKEKDDDEK